MNTLLLPAKEAIKGNLSIDSKLKHLQHWTSVVLQTFAKEQMLCWVGQVRGVRNCVQIQTHCRKRGEGVKKRPKNCLHTLRTSPWNMQKKASQWIRNFAKRCRFEIYSMYPTTKCFPWHHFSLPFSRAWRLKRSVSFYWWSGEIAHPLPKLSAKCGVSPKRWGLWLMTEWPHLPHPYLLKILLLYTNEFMQYHSP